MRSPASKLPTTSAATTTPPRGRARIMSSKTIIKPRQFCVDVVVDRCQNLRFDRIQNDTQHLIIPYTRGSHGSGISIRTENPMRVKASREVVPKHFHHCGQRARTWNNHLLRRSFSPRLQQYRL